MGNRFHWSHETTLQATPVSASQARVFVSRHLAEHQLSHLVDPVRLVASELATNALTHARTAFTVALSATPEAVLLSVSDGNESVPVRGSHRVTDSGGRGLQIVEALSVDWGVSTENGGSKTVWAAFAKETADADREVSA